MFGGKAKPDTPTCMTVSWPRVQQSSQCKFLLVDELHEVVEEELVFALSGGVVSLGEGRGESEARPKKRHASKTRAPDSVTKAC